MDQSLASERQTEVGRLLYEVKRVIAPGRGVEDVALLAQSSGQHGEQRPIVLGDQNPHRRSPPERACRGRAATVSSTLPDSAAGA